MAKKNPWRLNPNVLPTSYVVHLELNFKDFTFVGKETIDVHLKSAAREITLHSVGLEIKHAEASYLEDGDPQIVPEVVHQSYQEFETVRICFPRPIPAGDARLRIWFSGKITEDMTGLYRTPYKVGEEERIAAVTQCEATGCRRIFPCFDEPDKKAEFKLSLTVPKHLDAISNMPIWGIDDVPGFPDKKRVDFLSTPLMSTYLFTFVVAELEYLEGRTKNNTLVRVFTTPGKKDDLFTRQTGYPVICAEEEKNNNGKISLRLTQREFFIDGRNDPENIRWNIPLVIKTKYCPEPIYYLMQNIGIKIENAAEDVFDDLEGVMHRDCIIVNAGRTGFYRVAYSNDLFSRLTDTMKCGEIIDPQDRIGLIDDTVALARAGLYKTSAALELLNTCRDERECAVWAAIISALDEIHGIVPDLGALLAFQKLALNILRPALSRVGWDKKIGEPDLHGMLRPMLITALGRFNDSPTISEAFEQFGKTQAGFEISADIREAVYSIAAIYGNSAILDRLFALYDQTRDSQEKRRILNALAGAGCNSGSLVERVLEFLMSDKVLASDAPLVIERMGSHDKPCRIAWNFVKANWEEMVRRFHSKGGKLLPRAIEGLVSSFDRDWMVLDAEEFLQSHPLDGGERAVRRALEKARSNTAWYKRDPKDISEWLEHNIVL